MSKVYVDINETLGKIKPMNAVNNGPLLSLAKGQVRSNFDEYKAARIPFARNHDASEWIDYGGEFTVDVHSIFRNFDADPYDSASYEFAVTDAYTKNIEDSGTRTFYRLGERIEHQAKKYRTVKPADYKKWAVICEHIIKHYNEGWADGFYYGIKYWEIWNEPDLDPDSTPSDEKRCWSGTTEEFYEFYKVAAEHLKACFPDLMIGGPAIAHNTGAWLDGFLAYLTKDEKRVPLDFFSWHWYGTDTKKMIARAHIVREKLDRAGYTNTESHLNEWNYVADWGEGWVDTVLTMISMKGAAFITAAMCDGQKDKCVDMMMYYDASPCSMNGLFDFYTWRPIFGYWSIYAFSDLADLGECVYTESDDSDIYTLAARDEDGSLALIVCYYTDEEGKEKKEACIDINGAVGEVRVYTVDEKHSYEHTDTLNAMGLSVELEPNTFKVIKYGK